MSLTGKVTMKFVPYPLRVCTRCKEPKALSEFTKKKATKDGLNYRCKVCTRAMVKSHYDRNKKYYLDKARRNEKYRVEYIRKLKDSPCADCGKKYHYCQMDFDHIKGTKEFNIATEYKNISFARLNKELDKCELVCSNCHRLRTFKKIQAPIV